MQLGGNKNIFPTLMKQLIFLLTFVFVGCQSAEHRQNPYSAGVASDRVSIMTFNVENLFDTTHDPGKNDQTFLPLTVKNQAEHKKVCNKINRKKWRDQCLFFDWSEKSLKQKLSELSKAILSVNAGKGADILVLQEVENIAVLENLRVNYLAKAGYAPAILIEGRDKRGIDTAVLTRLPLADSPCLHYIPFKSMPRHKRDDTRPILEVALRLPDQTVLNVYANHFPAPFHPTKYREDGFKHLNKLVAQLPEARLFVAAGDFNVTSEERRKKKILRRLISQKWVIAHEQNKMNEKGTSYYPPKDDWSFLDMIIYSKRFSDPKSSWSVDTKSIVVANQYGGQKNSDGTPKGYKAGKGSGVSDHWPVYMELKSKK